MDVYSQSQMFTHSFSAITDTINPGTLTTNTMPKLILNYYLCQNTRRQCTYKHNIDARSPNHCCRGKAVSIKYYARVSVASVIQNAMCMRRIILSSLACPALPIFPHYSETAQFSGKKLLNIKCVLIFSTTFV